MRNFLLSIVTALGLLLICSSVFAESSSPYQIDAIPAAYHLQTGDDCGVPDRQPHVHAKDIYTFSPDDVQADEKARTVAWGDKKVEVNFDQLGAHTPYVVAVTYANKKGENRVQSIWAGSIQLQPPHSLPRGKSEQLFFRVPAEALQDGKLQLQFRLEAEVNVVVSAVELWSPASSPKVLHLIGVSGLMTDLEGQVLNVAYEAQADVDVMLSRREENKPLATTRTSADGQFHFARSTFEKIDRSEELRVIASHDNITAEQKIKAADLFFDPVRYRPLPAVVDGLDSPQQSLNGTWRINLDATDETRAKPLDAAGWSDIKVPGQWREQGFDVPRDKPALMAREFTIPAAWQGRRIILRFDAIHAGTQYWLNGKRLGDSENLFTLVEWDVTDIARVGETNRLDLKMIVNTASERLSSSSGYTGHSLGGIDRSVKIFALPDVHIATLHLNAGLDDQYQNGDLQIDLGLSNKSADARSGISVAVKIDDADGKPIHQSADAPIAIGSLKPGDTPLHIQSVVPNPRKWNAEQPNLYTLHIELCDGGKVLERIDRNIGFRKIELKGQQFYINGQRIKLAGVARHEVDPLTGRADTAKHAEEDIRLLKSANLNYIRTSHYPPTEEFLAAADKLGMYVECEAPFCWVATAHDLKDLRAVLTPSAARVDFCHTHPSIIVWSLANESNWSREFDIDNKLTKSLDPTRPTTFNHPFDNEKLENCDILNRHYLPMPFEDAVKGDPRPFIHGECFFEEYHERTDVGIDPGLRELWAQGSADPNSDFGKACAENWDVPYQHPGIYPGAWSYIVASNRFIGSVIWSGVDDIMFTRDGKKFSSENGNAYWGLVDVWRRPKPELWLAKLVFTPAWFPKREFDWDGQAASIHVPVENRYSFTNLSELNFSYEFAGKTEKLSVDLAPGAKGELNLPIPKTAKPGDTIALNVTNAGGTLVNSLLIHLGKQVEAAIPVPSAGAPTVKDGDKQIVVQGDRFALVLNKASGDFVASDPQHRAPVTHFPRLHATHFDFGDLASGFPAYGVLPDQKTRAVDQVSAIPKDAAIAITVKDHYENFAGATTWLIDRNGVGQISYDYIYDGPDAPIRELGVRLETKRECDEIRWRRWSEWDVFPDDHISRTIGDARATRDAKWGDTHAPESAHPTWPWSQDQTELGTNDFRAVKFNIYSANLLSPAGDGIQIHANADVHIRACLAPDGVLLHILSRCTLAPTILKKGDHLIGQYSVSIAHGG